MYEKTRNIAEWRQYLAGALEGVSPTPQIEADRLLGAALEQPRSWLLAHDTEAVAATAAAALERWLTERRAGVPLAYLLGHDAFWSLELIVTPDTLVPRPDTETLVERALALLEPQAGPRVADLGTGTGAIALAIASERPDATVVATDFSAAALAVASANAAALGFGNVSFAAGDWCAALGDARFDLIVSNPPYVETGYPGLQAQLRHEPRLALASGADGLDAIRTIAAQAPAHLVGGGKLLLEHGDMQAEAVSGILRARHFSALRLHRDLAGRPRVTEATRAPDPLSR